MERALIYATKCHIAKKTWVCSKRDQGCQNSKMVTKKSVRPDRYNQ